MGNRRKHDTGPQVHAEGQHGGKTHARFIEMLHEGRTVPEDGADGRQGRDGNRRLHEDRQQHDVAEKNAEKVEAMREIQRGHADDNVLAHARIPHEGDQR